MSCENAPRALADALALSDEPRMVTSAHPPYSIVHTNKAWSEATGFTFLEVVNKSSSVLNGPQTDPASVQSLQDALTAGTSPVSANLVSYRKDGTPFMSRLHCELVGNGSHWLSTIAAEPVAPGSVAAVPRPDSPLESAPLMPVNYAEPENYAGARKRVKRTASKLQLHAALNNSTDPLVLCSATYPHQILHPNQPWLEMCGYSLEEVEGLTNKILTGAETDPDAIAHLLECVRRAEPSVQTLVNYKKGGVRFVNQVRVLPVYDEHDEVAAFASMLHEVNQSHIGAAGDPTATEHLWNALCARLDATGARLGGGANGAARAEAARKLIENHAAVLADTTAPLPAPSQPTLERVPAAVMGYVDEALREVARRLILGDDSDASSSAIRGCPGAALSPKHPSRRAQQAAWAQTVAYLDARIQTQAEVAGRPADMSADAAAAMRCVLRDIGRAAAADA